LFFASASPGFPLQVLGPKKTGLWAFRYNPWRSIRMKKIYFLKKLTEKQQVY
jgi:hypothetical protein